MRANQEVWVTDISYILTWQGWLYLAGVIDLFARNVVGWWMKPTLSRELAQDVLMMAVWLLKTDGEIIVQSDHCSQYGSDEWQCASAGPIAFGYIEVFYNRLGGVSQEAF